MFIGIGILIVAIVASVIAGLSPTYALILGLFIFGGLAVRQGYSFKAVARMSWEGAYSARIVVVMMLIIGVLTATWRASGVIAYFVYYGVKIIQPQTFIIIAFALTSLLSYAVGSSFAVAASLGVIFMALARAGGVDPAIMGGVVMSGIYLGDRGAPTSSCAMLVASATETDHMDNVRRMFKYAIAPYLAAFAIYAVLSVKNPILSVDSSYLDKISETFVITPLAAVPAVIMLILPVLRFDVRKSMLISIVIAVAIAVFVQKIAVLELIKFCITGYTSKTEFGVIFNGGGLVSMLDVIAIVAISSAYAGIFNETGMLDGLKNKLEVFMLKTGRYCTTFCFGMLLSAISCNQSFATIMTGSLLGDIYEKNGGTRSELASDIQNSVVILLAMMPWTIACSGPLSFMGADNSSLIYSFFIYFVPVFYGFEKVIAYRYMVKKEK